jgi:hypothetical protein
MRVRRENPDQPSRDPYPGSGTAGTVSLTVRPVASLRGRAAPPNCCSSRAAYGGQRNEGASCGKLSLRVRRARSSSADFRHPIPSDIETTLLPVSVLERLIHGNTEIRHGFTAPGNDVKRGRLITVGLPVRLDWWTSCFALELMGDLLWRSPGKTCYGW